MIHGHAIYRIAKPLPQPLQFMAP